MFCIPMADPLTSHLSVFSFFQAWSKKLSLTFTVTRHIYLKNDSDDESLTSIEEDGDMHIDDNSIHYDEPLQNLRKSENRRGFERLERPLTNAQFMKRESTTTSDPLPTRYELDKFHKNAMIIFNHEIYSQRTCTPRIGTEHDKRELKKTFQRFRFEVTTYDDLRKEELLKKMKECKFFFIKGGSHFELCSIDFKI